MADALQGLRVIDAAQGIAGPFAARLLADMGAEVIKVEPPGGDLARRLPPLAENGEGSLFEYLNWGKRGAVLGLAGGGRDAFLELIREADVLIESFAPGELTALGLDAERLLEVNPALVTTSVTPFGSSGPRSHWQSDEIVDWAVGGYMYFAGHPERAPLMIPGYQAEYHAAQAVVLATLAALHERQGSGRGQWIDQSIQEATLATHAWLSVAWTHGGQVLRRTGPDLFRCRDGWVMWMRRMNEPVTFVLIDRPELMDDPRFQDPLVWRDPESEIWQHVRAWCAEQPKMEVYHRAQELRIAVTPANNVADLLESPQLKERDWFVQVPEGDSVRYAGFPYRFNESGPRVAAPAPALDEAAGSPLSWSDDASTSRWRREPASNAPRSTDGPLAGLRVIEVTANWAGPIAGRHLGDLGAEVIKVEHAKRPATRGLWYAGNDPRKYPHHRAGYFNKLNRNKVDVSLDLSTEEGRALFLKLVERSDVLIENNSARVMPNLGLDWETLAKHNSRLIMASISGFGATGPEQHYVAYGANIEASSGLASLMGYRDEEQPYRAGIFYADPIAGNYAAIAILAALRAREADGRGRRIDLSLNECAATFFGGAFIEYQQTGCLPPHLENRHPVFAPQGCYRTIGEDDWVVLTVRNQAEWSALCGLLGRDDWLADESLASESGRRAAHDALDETIAAWCAERDHNEAARELQAAGVPAAPVMANWELVSDAHLYHRDFYQPIEHPEVGVLSFGGPPWKLSRTPATIRRPAPLFAEHNDYVLGEVLGLSAEEIARLEASGICSREPETPAALRR